MGRGAVLAGLALMAGLAGPARAEEGGFFGNLFRRGEPTAPSSQPKEIGEAYCPTVDVADGSAAIRAYGGKAGAGGVLRHQITLGRLARECAIRVDGTVTVRVGVQVRVLLGPGGAPGRFDAPVTIAIKHEGKVVVARARKVMVNLGAGEAGGDVSMVEEDLAVPPAMAKDYEIEVSLGAAPKAPAKPPKGPVTSESFAPGTGAPQKE